MTVPAPPPPPAPRRLPPPSWPVWIAFALVLLLGALVLGLLGGSKDKAAERLAFQEDALDRSVVVTGTFVGEETNPGLPTATGIYSVTIPEAAGGEGESIEVGGDEHWGFPPSPDYPEELDFLILLDDPPRPLAHGPVGTIEPITDQSVQDAQAAVARAQTIWVVAIVLYWVLAPGLAALGVVLATRRRRAKRSVG